MTETVNVMHEQLRASIAQAQAEVLEVNKAHGWFDKERSFGDDIALLHSEVSEAYEAYRDNSVELMFPGYTTESGLVVEPELDPSSLPAELADIFIRLLDTCERYGVDLVEAFEKKLEYNRNRAYRHGGKKV